MSFHDYLLAGSFIFSGVFGWKLLVTLGTLRDELQHLRGLLEGWDLNERVTALERHVGLGVRE